MNTEVFSGSYSSHFLSIFIGGNQGQIFEKREKSYSIKIRSSIFPYTIFVCRYMEVMSQYGKIRDRIQAFFALCQILISPLCNTYDVSYYTKSLWLSMNHLLLFTISVCVFFNPVSSTSSID